MIMPARPAKVKRKTLESRIAELEFVVTLLCDDRHWLVTLLTDLVFELHQREGRR